MTETTRERRCQERGSTRRVGLVATASYLPERWLTAAEIGERAGIPERVIVEKFGLRGKHIAAHDEHVSDLSVKAAEALLAENGIDPASIDVVLYYGSMFKDYSIWQAAPHIAHRIGATRAFAIEYDNVSHGTSIALRVARDMLRAEPELSNILLVAACRESYLLDSSNERSRFMFNFGDGAVAGLLVGDADRNEVLGAHAITDGSYSLQVKVPGGGSVDPDGYRYLDVADPTSMKGGLDRVSLPNFLAVARGAVERSGLELSDVALVCPLHTKRSMFLDLLSGLEMREDQAVYLDDTGHMSGVDPLFALDRAARAGRLRDGDVALLLSAGTGYTWAASVVRWGPIA
ncbi:MAG: 3-oxoacyl-ACP synthase [Gaiellaceae bacterium]